MSVSFEFSYYSLKLPKGCEDLSAFTVVGTSATASAEIVCGLADSLP